MIKFSVVILLPVALAGFGGAATHDRTESLITLVEANNTGKQVRQLSFILTNEPATTCIGGDWKKAKVVNDIGKYTIDPAYTLKNGDLEILLTNQMCDGYDSYVGELSNGHFHGKHITYGLGFSETLGKVTGTYAAH